LRSSLRQALGRHDYIEAIDFTGRAGHADDAHAKSLQQPANRNAAQPDTHHDRRFVGKQRPRP
jgi:hypothetical protein